VLEEQLRSTTEFCSQVRSTLQAELAAVSSQRAQLEAEIAAHRRVVEEHHREVEREKQLQAEFALTLQNTATELSEQKAALLDEREAVSRDFGKIASDVRSQAELSLSQMADIIDEFREWAEKKKREAQINERLRRAKEMCAMLERKIDEVARGDDGFDVQGLSGEVMAAVDALETLNAALAPGNS
jgi:chromosome segregation ATPase